jgi:hypothetical protein
MQEHRESGQFQVEDRESEDDAVMEEELARVHQDIDRLHQEQEAITKRQAMT